MHIVSRINFLEIQKQSLQNFLKIVKKHFFVTNKRYDTVFATSCSQQIVIILSYCVELYWISL